MTELKQITVSEFCRRYGVGITTTYKLIGEGAIIARKYGRRTLIDVESAEAWRKDLPVASHFTTYSPTYRPEVTVGAMPRKVAKGRRDTSR